MKKMQKMLANAKRAKQRSLAKKDDNVEAKGLFNSDLVNEVESDFPTVIPLKGLLKTNANNVSSDLVRNAAGLMPAERYSGAELTVSDGAVKAAGKYAALRVIISKGDTVGGSPVGVTLKFKTDDGVERTLNVLLDFDESEPDSKNRIECIIFPTFKDSKDIVVPTLAYPTGTENLAVAFSSGSELYSYSVSVVSFLDIDEALRQIDKD